jgi:pimeloyl-ACP methyl ester carboxylesterase
MKKILSSRLYRAWLILLSGGLFACSTGDIPEKPASFFLTVSDSVLLDRASLVKRFAAGIPDEMLQLFPERQVQSDAIRYRSKDPAGNEVVASGIITYPSGGVFKGVVVGQHYSIGANREAPSSVMSIIESALSLFGYVVISPDYIGFGSTAGLPQTYIHTKSTGRVTVDMVFAAREYMESKGMPVGKEMYVAGYSQGGYSALAFAKMAEEEYPAEMPLLHVFAGGGPYVPESIFDVFAGEESLESPSTVLVAIVGLDYGDGLDIDYTKVFREPLLSNYKEWIVSKKYTLDEIDRLLGANRVSQLMHPDIFLPERNSEYNKLYGSLAANRLTGWTPHTPILLVHGTKDKTVPFVSAQTVYDTFKAKGCPVELRPVAAGHADTAISFYLAVLQHLR